MNEVTSAAFGVPYSPPGLNNSTAHSWPVLWARITTISPNKYIQCVDTTSLGYYPSLWLTLTSFPFTIQNVKRPRPHRSNIWWNGKHLWNSNHINWINIYGAPDVFLVSYWWSSPFVSSIIILRYVRDFYPHLYTHYWAWLAKCSTTT